VVDEAAEAGPVGRFEQTAQVVGRHGISGVGIATGGDPADDLVRISGGVEVAARFLEYLGARQKLTSSARIKLTTSKTPIATWHGTASVGSSPPPQAHKSFPGYARGRSHPRGAAARHETSLGADIAESGPGGWSFGEQGWVISRERRS